MFSKGFFPRVINSLPNNKNVDIFKMKAFVDNNSNVAQMMEFVFIGYKTF